MPTVKPGYPVEVADTTVKRILMMLDELRDSWGPSIVMDVLTNALGSATQTFGIPRTQVIDNLAFVIDNYEAQRLENQS